MKIVGQELERWALTQKNEGDKDLFARSAFNRYYYALFLVTRQMIGDFEAGWRGTVHAQIPNLLRTAVKKKVERSLKKAVRNDLMSLGESSRIRDEHNTSISTLATLLEEAYQVRIVADYEPEIVVEQTGSVISLDSHKLTSAKAWPDRASACCKSIRKVWKEAGLA